MTEHKKFVPVVCPFCAEADFDLAGLKIHLAQGWCEPYEALDGRTSLQRDMAALGEKDSSR